MKEPVFCVDCQHYLARKPLLWLVPVPPLCAAPLACNRVTGQADEGCNEMRTYGCYCGSRGEWFQRRAGTVQALSHHSVTPSASAASKPSPDLE